MLCKFLIIRKHFWPLVLWAPRLGIRGSLSHLFHLPLLGAPNRGGGARFLIKKKEKRSKKKQQIEVKIKKKSANFYIRVFIGDFQRFVSILANFRNTIQFADLLEVGMALYVPTGSLGYLYFFFYLLNSLNARFTHYLYFPFLCFCS